VNKILQKLFFQSSPSLKDGFLICSPRKVVADDEWHEPVMPAAVPPPNWETFPGDETDFTPGDIGSWSVVERDGKLTVIDRKQPMVTNSLNRAVKQKRREFDTHRYLHYPTVQFNLT